MTRQTFIQTLNSPVTVCRPALPMDTSQVMALTREIWNGGDYVPYVWSEWLADPQGLLAVAEYGGRVAGLCKLTRLSEQDWWLEGLRVDPQLERRGIASRLFDYQLDTWQRIGRGALRLTTASFRKAVHHLCERTGFKKLGELMPYRAGPLPVGGIMVPPGESLFAALQPAEIPEALQYARRSPSLPLTYGLMDLGWRWAAPDENHLAHAVPRSMAWWWRGRDGLLVAYEDWEPDEAEKWLAISLLACGTGRISECLLDCRRLAALLGYPRLACTAPLRPELQPVLTSAGFEPEWDFSIYLFEKKSES
jgi:GNAT superfamily N-acetyltransferase